MKPPTTSLTSTNGPSTTPDAVTTRPSDSSLAPMSRMASLNFSFHALKAANICCICSGEGPLRPPER